MAKPLIPNPISVVQAAPQNARSFAQGAQLFFESARFLAKKPRFWPLVLIPLVLNALILSALIFWGFHAFAGQLREWTQGLTAWYWTALVVIIKVLFWLIVLGVVYFIFTPLALIIAAPFNDRIAELTERAEGFGLEDGAFSARKLIGEILFTIRSEIRRILFCGGVFLLLLGLHLIPIIGSVLYPVAAFYWASRCFAYEFISYAADRRRLGFQGKWRLLRTHYPVTLGFGVVAAGLFLVPFVNVLVVPICAVAGTKLFGLMQKDLVAHEIHENREK